MSEQLDETQQELQDIKAAVAVSEANKEEEITKIRQQCHQEVETMQALLRGMRHRIVLICKLVYVYNICRCT